MRVVVTRPEREAAGWAEALQARGFPALALPLIAIGPAPDRQALQAARERVAQFAAAMFVSANAVSSFFEGKEPVARVQWALPAIKTRAWATGPGTVQALLAAGVAAGMIDAPPADSPQFDSEALWRQVSAQVGPGDRVLLVRGAGPTGEAAGRDWLADRLKQAGAKVEAVAAYVRLRPQWTAEQTAAAREAAQDGSVWLFSSSEAIANLQALLPRQDWSGSLAIATHERIAKAAREAGFGVVCPSRPGVEAVGAVLESIG